jgi:methanogenic corrinoid protein MtbC1
MDPYFPIKIVAQRTGLSPHVIRMWERRYQAIIPQRTPTHRRLYSAADIERLTLLHQAILAGHSIGQLAHLPTKKLMALIDNEATPPVHRSQIVPDGEGRMTVRAVLAACVRAVEQLDAEGLDEALARAAVELGQVMLVEQIIPPLMQRIGDLWHGGHLRVAHEHMASAVVRTVLGSHPRFSLVSTLAPHLIVATPAGQVHELGALVVAATAAAEGWRVTYLGPNLPAQEIAGAAALRQARAVALSIVYPADDPYLRQELHNLRRFLGKEVVVLVGGRAAAEYRDVFETIHAVHCPDITGFRAALAAARSRQPSAVLERGAP